MIVAFCSCGYNTGYQHFIQIFNSVNPKYNVKFIKQVDRSLKCSIFCFEDSTRIQADLYEIIIEKIEELHIKEVNNELTKNI